MTEATQISLSDDDVEAIVRAAATEVGHGGYIQSHPQTITAMAEAVADTILNRVASPQFPNSVSDVVNEPWQFSAINAGRTAHNPRVYGSWQNVPNSAVDPSLREAITSHLDRRMQGAPSRLAQMGVPGAVNFANPNASSPRNVRGWINPMISSGAQRLGIGQFEHYHGTAPGRASAIANLGPPQFGPAVPADYQGPQFANVPSPAPSAQVATAAVPPTSQFAGVANPSAVPGSPVASFTPHPVTPVESAELDAITEVVAQPATRSGSTNLGEVFSDLSTPVSASIQGSPTDHQYTAQDNRTVEREIRREQENAPRISSSFTSPTASPAQTGSTRREESTPRLSESVRSPSRSNTAGSIYDSGRSALSNVFQSPTRTTSRRETTPRMSETSFRTVSREVANPAYSAWESTYRSIDQASPTDFQYAAQDARELARQRAAATPPPPRTITVRERIPIVQPIVQPTPIAPPRSSGVDSFIDGMNGSTDRGYTEDSQGRTGWGAGRSNSYQRAQSGVGGGRAYGGRDQSFTENARSSSWGGGGDSGGGGMGGGRVICTHFFRKGWIDPETWRADLEFTSQHLSEQTVRGYQFWAIPYVKLMRKSPLAEKLMWPIAKHRARELAHKMGKTPRGSLRGKLVRLVFEPACWVIGGFIGDQNWQSLWEEPAK